MNKEPTIKLKLTTGEWSVLKSILSSTTDCLEWDKDTQTYTDGGKFILSLEKNEYKELIKLNGKT